MTDMRSQWVAAPVQVDGDMGEWIKKPTIYIEDPGVMLGLSNNQENLYILFRFKDKRWARVIRLNGLTLWLDPAGKRKKDLSVRYNGGPPLSEMNAWEGRGGFRGEMPPDVQGQLAERLEEFAGPADQITIMHKKKDLGFSGPARDTGGISAAFDALPDTFTYEFSIPLEPKNNDGPAIKVHPGQTLALGFEWGMDKDDLERMRESMGNDRDFMDGKPPDGIPGGGGMVGGMPGGGMIGGDMGGGRGGSGRGGQMKPPEKEEVWIKVALAPAPAE